MGEEEEVQPPRKKAKVDCAALAPSGLDGGGDAAAEETSSLEAAMTSVATATTPTLLQVLSPFFHSAKYSDVVLEVNGTRFPCHKLILASWSTVFERAIEAASKQKEGSAEPLLELRAEVLAHDDISWHQVLQYLYSMSIELSNKNVFAIMEVAIHYRFYTLLHLCQQYLLKSATPDNLCLYYAETNRLGLSNLVEKIKFLCFAQLGKVLSTESFQQLPFEVLHSWVLNDDMGISELVVFDAIISWAKGDLPARKPYLNQLLQLVRFPFLDSKTLAQLKQRVLSILCGILSRCCLL